MPDQNGGSNPLTKKLGPLPIWAWMALVFVGVVVWQYARGKTSTTDQQTGLKAGSAADEQARAAMARSSVMAGGAQTPPTIIQNYPAPTTIAFPVRGSRFGFNGAPTWPIGSWHRGRHGGPGPHGPGHHPHGPQWHGGEHHGPHPRPGFPHPRPGFPHHQGHGGPEHGGHHGGRPDHDHHGGPMHGGPPMGHGGGRPEHDHHGEEHGGGRGGGRGGGGWGRH